MKPVVSPAQMRAFDERCGVPEEVLIERAGRAVAWTARSMLGGVYGRRVTVLAGPGNNGADGLVAARVLAFWGVAVRVIRVGREAPPPIRVDDADLVIDALFGTGIVREVAFPSVGVHTKVLSVDIPSGVDARTGELFPGCSAPHADVTVTLVAPKPGLLFEPGASFAGDVRTVDIGIDPSAEDPLRTWLLDEGSVRERLRRPAVGTHKWKHAVLVVAGSAGMTGAAVMCAHSAARSGASLVRLAIPGIVHGGDEVVGVDLPSSEWALLAAGYAARCSAVVVGPGLGSDGATRADVRALLDVLPAGLPVILDGDGLGAVTPELLASSPRPMILTPHDGEFTRLSGNAPSSDRISATRELALRTNSVVLLKGPTTVVASPDGQVEVVRSADQRLATAGSGDVLAGVIAAFCAGGMDLFHAASTAAFVHGTAAMRGRPVGLVAGDLPVLIADLLSEWLGRVATAP